MSRLAEKFRYRLGVTAEELAEILGVSPFIVNEWAKKRKLSSFREGRTRVFLLPVVLAEIARRMELAPSSPDRRTAEMLLLDWLHRTHERAEEEGEEKF